MSRLFSGKLTVTGTFSNTLLLPKAESDSIEFNTIFHYNKSMNTINEDIKTGQFHRAYLLFGDEEYLIRQYRTRLITAIVGDEDSMNFQAFKDDKINLEEIIDLAETMPFFAEHRVISVEGSGFFKSSNEKLAEYLTALPDTCILIFTETDVDRRSKTYKSIVKNGYACDFSMPDENTLLRWIGGRLNHEKKTMAREAWPVFYDRCSDSMDLMSRELDKLLSYTADKDHITKEDVEAITCIPLRSRIFDMIDAIAKKDAPTVLNYYRELLAMKEPPLKILALIVRNFRQMLAIREMTDEHINDADIAKHLGVRNFVVSKSRSLSRSFSMEQIHALLEDAAETETLVKTGRLDATMAVELLMLRYCS